MAFLSQPAPDFEPNLACHLLFFVFFFAPLQNVDNNTILPATYDHHHQRNPFYQGRPLNVHLSLPPPQLHRWHPIRLHEFTSPGAVLGNNFELRPNGPVHELVQVVPI